MKVNLVKKKKLPNKHTSLRLDADFKKQAVAFAKKKKITFTDLAIQGIKQVMNG